MEFTNRCGCPDCARLRAWNDGLAFDEQAKARPVNPFAASTQELYSSLAALNNTGRPVAVPFEPEPLAEPVYTHVLLPYYELGEPIAGGAELHTAESLIEAMSLEQSKGYGFKVYKLSECIFSIDPADNSE
jgi:hypothetical protein